MGGAQVQMARNRMQRWVRDRCQHGDGHGGNLCATLEGRRSPGFCPAHRGREGKETSTGPGWKWGQSCITKEQAWRVLTNKMQLVQKYPEKTVPQITPLLI